MSCDKLVAVKNILMTFTNCETGEVFGPISHRQANDDLPKIRSWEFSLEDLAGGRVKKNHRHAQIEVAVIRNLRIPMKDYQGRSSIDIQIEYDNGLVFTGKGGNQTGEEAGDTFECMMDLSFDKITELLPAGALSTA